MPTNLALDDRLIDEARKLGRHRTKRDTVNAALRDYVRRLRQMRILTFLGTIDFDPAWNAKRSRRKPR